MKHSFLYGSVLKLTREDTAESIERHLALMKESGMDTVVIWPAFSGGRRKKKGIPSIPAVWCWTWRKSRAFGW